MHYHIGRYGLHDHNVSAHSHCFCFCVFLFSHSQDLLITLQTPDIDNNFNSLIARRGLIAVVAVRLVPAAPFALVNLILGATRIGWAPFLAGNVLGMLPMVSITAWLAPQILAQIQEPSGAGWAVVAAVLLLVAVATWGLKRWAKSL